jgi:hypothetical protein
LDGIRPDTYKYEIVPNKTFGDYRYEQQAAILADYYLAKYKDGTNLSGLEKLLFPENLGAKNDDQKK